MFVICAYYLYALECGVQRLSYVKALLTELKGQNQWDEASVGFSHRRSVNRSCNKEPIQGFTSAPHIIGERKKRGTVLEVYLL